MAITTRELAGCLVTYDTNTPHRWLDVTGEAALKYANHFTVAEFANVAAATGTVTAGWKMTLVEGGAGESTLTAGTTAGGTLVITTDNQDNDGINLQLDGEAFQLNGLYPAYFGIKFKMDTATQSDFLVGLCITNTNLLGGLSDGVYFRKVDGSTDVYFVLEKDSVESTTAVDTCVADAWVTYEFVTDGVNIQCYVDGALVTTVACSNVCYPNDEALTPSIHVLTGAAAVTVATVDWLRVFQLR